MKVEQALSIDELYQRVNGYDLVLTVEAPLTDALNNRVEKPVLGIFAITPKRLALESREEFLDKRELFIKIVQETDLSWKQSSYLLENVIDCWKETGDPSNILEYEQFDHQATREVIEIVRSTPNPFSFMEEYEVSADTSVAVINEYQFNALDKKVLPETYDEINSFSAVDEERTRDLPSFKVFNSSTEIIQALRSNISREIANDVAIVMEPESRYQSLVESMLHAENIPYMIREEFTENIDLRTLLSLSRASLTRNRLRLRDVQPILRHFHEYLPTTHNEQYLTDLELDNTVIDSFRDFLAEINDSTFAEVIEEYEEWVERDLEEVRLYFEELNLLNERVSEADLNKLEFYLQSFDIPLQSSLQGVLFVSPKAVAYVDRPVIFYLGMTSAWTTQIPEKPWIDEEAFEEKHVQNFKILLQNGEEQQQHYLVQNKRMNNPVTPCFYFHKIFQDSFTTFLDLPHTRYQGRESEHEKVKAFSKEDYDVEPETVETVSQNDLNNFVQCPRQYMFSKLVRDTENQYLKKGIVYHDFAEFYLNHQKFTEQHRDDIITVMMQEIKPYIDNLDLTILETELRVGTNNIMEYIKKHDYEETDLAQFGKRENDTNFLATHYDKPIQTMITEMWFDNPDLGGKGKVDLIQARNHLVDYKSSSKQSGYTIVKRSNLDLLEKEEVEQPNFQAILYLTQLREVVPNTPLQFTFVHFLENINDVIADTASIEDTIVSFTYYPKTFQEKIAEREAFDYLVHGVVKSNNRRKTLERLGFQKYHDFFSTHALPNVYDKAKLLDSDLTDVFIRYAQEAVGEYKYVKKGCKSALKKLVSFRKRNYFKEDLDAFQEALHEWIQEINKCRESSFPVGDADLDKVRYRELILREE